MTRRATVCRACPAVRGIGVHVLAPDLAARGLHSDLPAVDYAGFVELLAAHERAVH